ncbi:histidinol phosphate phosphatase [Sphingomonas sp. BN140010]|uniref:Histidinol phosphate phosphatase n=1 Tax=Sphingomonas arvum TaxID=2992113 RepID=A0ABT3JBZ2_9SPHN|nr:inositol monophosphatase family protein [Sphingomonas sp. BN140010]MCW3796592.1 histidinol phosphate phosphatase [Sphingomonas sp. BN140010]
MPDLPAFFAELSRAARDVTLGAAVPTADNKAGEGSFDPVTELDRAAERALRALIEARFPEDGIEGEEYGLIRADARRRWLIDPIDGTRALICGLPSWTTLVALFEDGEPIVGMIDAPVLDEFAVGLPGTAMLNGRTLRTSGCATLAEARLSTTDPFILGGGVDAFERIRHCVRVTRYGLDALAYARLAAGSLDLVVENGLQRYDWGALLPVVRGAGGMVGNWRGGRDLSGGDLVAAATPALFDQAVSLLNS